MLKWPRKSRSSLPSVWGPKGGWDRPPAALREPGKCFSLVCEEPEWQPGKRCPFMTLTRGVVCPELFLICLPGLLLCHNHLKNWCSKGCCPASSRPSLPTWKQSSSTQFWKRSGKARSSKVENCTEMVTPSMTDTECWWRGKAGVRQRDMRHRQGSSSSTWGQQRQLGCADGAQGPRLWSSKFVHRQVDPSASLQRSESLDLGCGPRSCTLISPGPPDNLKEHWLDHPLTPSSLLQLQSFFIF